MSRTWIACCVLAAAGAAQDKDFGTAPPALGVLARDPRDLPRAAAEQWSGWKADTPLPAELLAPFAEGTRAYQATQYSVALERFLGILERVPDFPPALYQGGLCYFRLKRYRDCAVLIERFEHAAPQEIGATQVLGHCYYTLGEYSRALEQYHQVLAVSPESVEALRGLALTRMRLGELELALELLSKVVQLRPTHADAWTWIGQIQGDLGRTDEALQSIAKAKELAPYEPRAWFVESRLLLELGKEAEAERSRERFELLSRANQEVRMLQGLLAQDPKHVEPLLRWVEIERSLGNLTVVRELLERLKTLRTGDVESCIYSLDVLQELGDSEGAREAARELEACAGKDVRAWKRLEGYFSSVRDRVRQVQAAERVLRLQAESKQ